MSAEVSQAVRRRISRLLTWAMVCLVASIVVRAVQVAGSSHVPQFGLYSHRWHETVWWAVETARNVLQALSVILIVLAILDAIRRVDSLEDRLEAITKRAADEAAVFEAERVVAGALEDGIVDDVSGG